MSAATDRELLELAAKAAGYDVIWNEHWSCFQHKNPTPDAYGCVRHPWTPDTDDGDSLRLAVKLKMAVAIFDEAVGIGCKQLPDGQKYVEFMINGDVDATTRYAIVLSAAEIGKETP